MIDFRTIVDWIYIGSMLMFVLALWWMLVKNLWKSRQFNKITNCQSCDSEVKSGEANTLNVVINKEEVGDFKVCSMCFLNPYATARILASNYIEIQNREEFK